MVLQVRDVLVPIVIKFSFTKLIALKEGTDFLATDESRHHNVASPVPIEECCLV